MSIETTTARAAARDAEDAAKRHRQHCVTCSNARYVKDCCSEGIGMRKVAAGLRATAREYARQDRAPGPYDVPLFDLPKQSGA